MKRNRSIRQLLRKGVRVEQWDGRSWVPADYVSVWQRAPRMTRSYFATNFRVFTLDDRRIYA